MKLVTTLHTNPQEGRARSSGARVCAQEQQTRHKKQDTRHKTLDSAIGHKTQKKRTSRREARGRTNHHSHLHEAQHKSLDSTTRYKTQEYKKQDP